MKYNPPFVVGGNPDPNAGYVDKDVPNATVGSKVPRRAVEDPQREIGHVIDFFLGNGTDYSAQSAADLQQLRKAIQAAATAGSTVIVNERFTNRVILSTTGAFTFNPTYTGRHRITLWGAGGGGGGGTGTGVAGGGGGGAYIEDFADFTIGTPVTGSIGAGGAGSAPPGTGGAGTATTMAGRTAPGGQGGPGANAGGFGLGGGASAGTGVGANGVTRSGSSGYQGTPQISQAGAGGQGGGPGGGQGATPSFGGGNGGFAPGGGGGGSTNGSTGGAGARGEVWIEW